jgi:hypothetical protein
MLSGEGCASMQEVVKQTCHKRTVVLVLLQVHSQSSTHCRWYGCRDGSPAGAGDC